MAMILVPALTTLACGPSVNPDDEAAAPADSNAVKADVVQSSPREEVQADSNLGVVTLTADNTLETIQADTRKGKATLSGNVCTREQRGYAQLAAGKTDGGE